MKSFKKGKGKLKKYYRNLFLRKYHNLVTSHTEKIYEYQKSNVDFIVSWYNFLVLLLLLWLASQLLLIQYSNAELNLCFKLPENPIITHGIIKHWKKKSIYLKLFLVAKLLYNKGKLYRPSIYTLAFENAKNGCDIHRYGATPNLATAKEATVLEIFFSHKKNMFI